MAYDVDVAHGGFNGGGMSPIYQNGIYPQNTPQVVAGDACKTEQVPLRATAHLMRNHIVQPRVFNAACGENIDHKLFEQINATLKNAGKKLEVGTRIKWFNLPESSVTEYFYYNVQVIGGFKFEVFFDDGTTETSLGNIDGTVLGDDLIPLAPIFATTNGAFTPFNKNGFIILEVTAAPAAPTPPTIEIPGYCCDCDCGDGTFIHMDVSSVCFGDSRRAGSSLT